MSAGPRAALRALLTTFVVLAPVAAVVAGCREATSVMVTVSTDLPCADAKTVTTDITAGHLDDYETRPPNAETTRCDEATGHIGSIVFLPSGNDDDEIAIRVVTATRGKAPATCAADPAGCIVARRVLHFVSHETVELPIVMRNSCIGVACATGQTCIAGACVGAEVSNPDQCVEPNGCDESTVGNDAGAGASSAPTPTPSLDGGKPEKADGKDSGTVDAGAPKGDEGGKDKSKGKGKGKGPHDDDSLTLLAPPVSYEIGAW